MYQSFEIKGVISVIENEVVFGPKYTEKTFVIEYNASAEYLYDVALTLANTKIGLINGFKVGDKVKVMFNISSRKVKNAYYTKLNVWKIDKDV